MKYLTMTLLFIGLLALGARAEDEKPAPEGEAPASDIDPAKLLADLTAANDAKDTTAISLLLDKIAQYGKTAKDDKFTDPLGKELTESFKIAKGNWGTLRKILDTLGELRSKKALSTLKKVAFVKKVKDEESEQLQIHAIAAVGAYADSKMIDPLVDLTKNPNTKIAIAAYAAFKNYGVAKGKERKKVAEELMKRLESENPYTTSSSGNNPGAAAIERWGEVQKPVVTSLQAICREATINDIDNWREWWKENKKNKKAWKDK
jgi:hypothetical protein